MREVAVADRKNDRIVASKKTYLWCLKRQSHSYRPNAKEFSPRACSLYWPTELEMPSHLISIWYRSLRICSFFPYVDNNSLHLFRAHFMLNTAAVWTMTVCLNVSTQIKRKTILETCLVIYLICRHGSVKTAGAWKRSLVIQYSGEVKNENSIPPLRHVFMACTLTI